MKTGLITALLLCWFLTGCQKQQAATIDLNLQATALEQSDQLLGIYIEKLDSEFTVPEIRRQILCKDYAHEYIQHYMPNLLKLNTAYTKAVLFKDMQATLHYYRQQEHIQCCSGARNGLSHCPE